MQPLPMGLQIGQPMGDNGEILLTQDVANTIADSGATWIRIHFRLGNYLNWTDPSINGRSALSVYDVIIGNARRANLKVLGLLSNESLKVHRGIPDWEENAVETGGSNGDNPFNPNFSQNAAIPMMRHFAGQVDWWEIWNEPNLTETHMYPSNFAWLLSHVYSDVHLAGLTNVRIVSAGLFGANGPDLGVPVTPGNTGADYLTQTYTQGIAHADWEVVRTATGSYPLDAVGSHLYIDPGGYVSPARFAQALDYVHQAYANFEGADTPKKIMITEMGWVTGYRTEGAQALNLRRAYAEIRLTPYVGVGYWFFLRDEPTATLYFGLRKSDNSPKLSWTSYQAYAKATHFQYTPTMLNHPSISSATIPIEQLTPIAAPVTTTLVPGKSLPAPLVPGSLNLPDAPPGQTH